MAHQIMHNDNILWFISIYLVAKIPFGRVGLKRKSETSDSEIISLENLSNIFKKLGGYD